MELRARRWTILGCLARGVFSTLLLTGCGERLAAPTPFLPPAGGILLSPPTPLFADQYSFLPADTPSALSAPQTSPCRNDLQFLEDLTIPDRTLVAPGSLLDKQWRVKNSGDCHWDGRYRLRLVSGDALGAAPEQALYPARAGAEAVLHILFTAPLEAGFYRSEWQAYTPENTSFGDPVFIEIIVSP